MSKAVLIIKGMEMPKSCADCFFRQAAPNSLNVYFCYADKNKRYAGHDKRPSFCPLVEIPTPHGELIDRDVLLRDHVHKDDMMAYCDDFVYKTAIEDMPTIIKAEE